MPIKPFRHKIVFLNGPTRSGKDTAGRFILNNFENTRHYKMTWPMDRGLCALYNIDARRWKVMREAEKDKAQAELLGQSPREALINFFTKYIKPVFGPAALGVFASRELAHTHQSKMTVITDSGVFAEAAPLITAFGTTNCLVVHLHRPGHEFTDYREYWEADGVTSVQLNNTFEGDLEMFEHQTCKIIEDWCGLPRKEK